jgi:hypothetical protein
MRQLSDFCRLVQIRLSGVFAEVSLRWNKGAPVHCFGEIMLAHRGMRQMNVGVSLWGVAVALWFGQTISNAAQAQSTGAGDAPRSRLVLNEQPTGEKYFALALVPPAEAFRKAVAADQGVDVVALMDTSASQTGVYRTDATTALRSLLASLSPQDRVQLMAVDLQAVDLSGGFVGPVSRETQAALKKLEQREPLGSTDLAAALEAAIKSFDGKSTRPRAVVYLGDGMSKANFLVADEFAALASNLVTAQSPVHCYAIGPQRDLQLLAALANHTGGTVYVDAAEVQVAQQAGAALASVVHGPVFWPTRAILPASMKAAYPQPIPPFRLERETVIVGVFEGEGPQSVQIEGKVNGQEAQATWRLAPEGAADDFVFLPQLVESARRDRGVALPTLGMEGLREVGRIMLARAENLTKMGARELAGGNLTAAQKLIETARATDPNNPEAAALEKAIQKEMEAARKSAAKQAPAPSKGRTDTPGPPAKAAPRS